MTAPLARFSGQSVENRNRLLLAGFAMMVAATVFFGLEAFANPAGMFLGAAFLGLHMAMTHSITVSMASNDSLRFYTTLLQDSMPWLQDNRALHEYEPSRAGQPAPVQIYLTYKHLASIDLPSKIKAADY
jgi:hypothetical protein